jgi:hypothetical protein
MITANEPLQEITAPEFMALWVRVFALGVSDAVEDADWPETVNFAHLRVGHVGALDQAYRAGQLATVREDEYVN